MPARVAIGEFSVMTGLSKKALRHYHEVGLLEPAQTDPYSGYRYYDTSQVQQAHLIRRFRGLGLSVPDVKAVLATSDVDARSAILAGHLERMETQLLETRDAVAALRELLAPSAKPLEVELRRTPATPVAAITETVPLQGISEWFSEAVNEIWAVIGSVQGPSGGYYATELFTDELGEATVFIPTTGAIQPTGRVRDLVLPAAEWAVAVHHGTHTGIDRTYGALGSFVAERMLGVDGPVRENYLTDGPDGLARTEICWPVFQTSTRRPPESE
jgi:DNA-binding transcriptional MerR regulator